MCFVGRVWWGLQGSEAEAWCLRRDTYRLLACITLHATCCGKVFREGLEPPHIHVETRDNAAKFWLTPVELAWTVGYNPRELRQLRELVAENAELFLEKWNEHFNRR